MDVISSLQDVVTASSTSRLRTAVSDFFHGEHSLECCFDVETNVTDVGQASYLYALNVTRTEVVFGVGIRECFCG